MKNYQRPVLRVTAIAVFVVCLTIASHTTNATTGTCGGVNVTLPFSDVVPGNVFFCSIAEAYFSGITNGTSPTTYSPGDNLLREQMAAFITRTLDQSLKRGSRRTLVSEYWNPPGDGLGLVAANDPRTVKCDGADLWVTLGGGQVARVRASDGKLLETWSGGTNVNGLVVANGRVYVAESTTPGGLLQIDPRQPAGAMTSLTNSLGARPNALTFDGARVWSANDSGSVSIVTLNPINVTAVTTGFVRPFSILYDGANVWVADMGDGRMKKLDASGNILQSILVTGLSVYPCFDGTNIWVPRRGNNFMNIIRVKDTDGNPLASASIVATITGNGLLDSTAAAFDGQRVLISNGGNTVSLFKASDFSPIGNFPMPARVTAACSDGLNFWLTLESINTLARF